MVTSFRIWWVSLFYVVVDDRARAAPLPRRVELGQEHWRQPAVAGAAAPEDLSRHRSSRLGCASPSIPVAVLPDSFDDLPLDATDSGGAAASRSGIKHRFEMKLVNPANKRKYTVIVVGSGLAGGAAAATMGELGYNVKCFCFQDSPRRAHSIAAQGGINAAKNYQNDGDSVYRLFYDTIKGGDFRSREGERLPAGGAQRQHHRSVRGAGRSVRARVRRACLRTGRSAARRSRERSMRAVRRGSSFCSARTRRSSDRSQRAV